MLIDNLKKIINNSRSKGLSDDYIKTELKEELIYYALDFIYNSPKWNSLVFGGGTALKVVGKTARLSEDLDIDYLDDEFKAEIFLQELLKYFERLGIKNLSFGLKQSGKNITLKFPILKELGLIQNIKSESDLLHLKIEVEKNRYSKYKINSLPISRDNLFMVVKHYSLEDLFANKIGAILGRKNKVFQNKYDFRGRDFYDLIWFLQQNIQPNLDRLKQIIKTEHGMDINDYQDVYGLIEKRIDEIDTLGIYEDMKNLIQQEESVKQLAINYKDIFKQLTEQIKKAQ